ncbi:MAG: sulfotransferase domain-containing protein [Caulobacteraceae bacterium]
MLARAPTKSVRSWVSDSRHWERYAPRAGDIIIGTAAKCGTTWMQRIVGLLVFQSPEPVPIHELSPWLDSRFIMPVEAMLAELDAQTHRRFLKTHLPLDAVPLYDEVRYVHVARDGRDACFSFHNHVQAFTKEALDTFDRIGLEDETIRAPMGRMPADLRDFFHAWLGPQGAPSPGAGYFELEQSYWAERARSNLLLVHYNDLKADLSGEMKRIGRFLGIEIPPALWPELVEAATFARMKRDGLALMPRSGAHFRGGHESFLYKGTNERWRGVLNDADLALYRERAEKALTPGLRDWLQHGRLKSADPTTMAD